MSKRVKQQQLDDFIEHCKYINPSFKSEKHFGKPSCFNGLLNWLSESINNDNNDESDDKIFRSIDAAKTRCVNRFDERLKKYEPALGHSFQSTD
jgi:hypothetical protein